MFGGVTRQNCAMPELHYWFSGAAIYLLLSFAITVIIGVIPMIDGKKRGAISILLAAGLVVAVLGWWTAAKQEKASDQQSIQLGAVGGQLSDLLVKMNRVMNIDPSADKAALAPNTPRWVKIAYDEISEREIPGPQENPRIVQYFKSVGAKTSYRDDVDDWASAFTEWSLNQAGIHGPKSDDPFAWLQWGSKLDEPVLGCIVVMSFSGLRHVGFYFGEEGDFVRVLGGNEDDAVNIFRYPKTAVHGYRWPPGLKLANGH